MLDVQRGYLYEAPGNVMEIRVVGVFDFGSTTYVSYYYLDNGVQWKGYTRTMPEFTDFLEDRGYQRKQ